MKRTHKDLVDEALRETRAIGVAEAGELLETEGALFVDVRDVRELRREGKIPGAFHAPRGMLEFWVDPTSPYYKDAFAAGRALVLYCALDWRAVLATKTLQDMGLEDVRHLEGGFKAWREAGLPVDPPEGRK
ncbi:MAG: rhodanese-like domain-containing protein [Alphaproteobacteria bacterium]|nr:rhodanese-like domain-containing protein [Alphaproteobacteria bacterium]